MWTDEEKTVKRSVSGSEIMLNFFIFSSNNKKISHTFLFSRPILKKLFYSLSFERNLFIESDSEILFPYSRFSEDHIVTAKRMLCGRYKKYIHFAIFRPNYTFPVVRWIKKLKYNIDIIDNNVVKKCHSINTANNVWWKYFIFTFTMFKYWLSKNAKIFQLGCVQWIW